MQKIITLIKQHIIIIGFICCYLLFSLITYKTYPIANGEEYRYLRGKETLDHLLTGQFTEKLIQPLPNYFLYNLYPMIMVFLNPKFYYEWFHLMNLVFSSLGFVAVYFLALGLTKSKSAAFLSLLALVLFPGFFGQLAINPVDMPFMVFYLLVLLSLLKHSNKETGHWSTLLLGVLFGITQGLRQIGLTLYLVMVVLDVYDYFVTDKKNFAKLSPFIKERILKYIFILMIANFFMVITWPNFAINFFKNYHWYLFIGSNFYLWDFGLLFFGKFLTNPQRPWYYLPFLQLITYPVYIAALFLPTVAFIKNKFRDRTYFIITFTIALNYFIYLAMHPVLYDGIRHFLFLIPLITVLAISNLITILELLSKKPLKVALIAAITLNLFGLVIYTHKEFPYIYPYFNSIAFAFGNPYKLFESDYSNTKYKEATEWLRETYLHENPQYNVSDPKLMLKVYPCDNAYAVDYYSHKKFLTVINKEDADLILCDYRNTSQSGYSGEVIKVFYLNGYDMLYVTNALNTI